MTTFFSYFLVLASVIICIPSLILFVETFAAVFLPVSNQIPVEAQRVGTIAVLVPAHNESDGIASTLNEISKQLGENDRLIVVADNCQDDTAMIANASGAQVIARDNIEQRGKGYAIAFGIALLSLEPPDTVIMIDADCHLGPDTIGRLAIACTKSNRPTQALNLMKAPANRSDDYAIAEFAWIIRNQIRPLGLSKMGLPCQLMGTGMAFPWKIISQQNFASGSIVEDLELGIKLAQAGFPAQFCTEALVTSQFPITKEGIVKQRQRWEHGSVAILIGKSVQTCFKAISSGNLPAFIVGLDLMVPPLTIHAISIVAMFTVDGLGWITGVNGGLPFAIAMLSGTLFATSILFSWARFGRKALPANLSTLLISHLATKLKVYKGFGSKREWIRSDRDGGQFKE